MFRGYLTLEGMCMFRGYLTLDRDVYVPWLFNFR